jgi:rubrerythrin
MEEKLFRNFYKCPKCGYEWSDTWDSKCNDFCPACQERDITPYQSDDISEGE